MGFWVSLTFLLWFENPKKKQVKGKTPLQKKTFHPLASSHQDIYMYEQPRFLPYDYAFSKINYEAEAL